MNKSKFRGKGSAKKGGKDIGIQFDPVKVVKQILQEYEKACIESGSSTCPSVKLALRDAMDQEKILSKFIICPRDRKELTIWADEDLMRMFDKDYQPKPVEKKKRSTSRSRSRSQSSRRAPKKGEPPSGQVLINRFLKHDPPSDKPLVRVQPVLDALRAKRYTYINSLYIWDMVLDIQEISSISSFIRKGFYALTKLELIDCLMPCYCLKSFAESLGHCKTLTEVILDCNEIEDDGCAELCAGLVGNATLTTLSLCYCNLTYISGKCLGMAVCNSAILDLFLDGNELEAEGCIYLVETLSEYAQTEAREREEALKRKLEEEAQKALKALENASTGDAGSRSNSAKKKGKKKKAGKKGKRGKRKKAADPIPTVAPIMRKLHLADNGIDQVGRGSNFGCLKCVILLCNMIECSKSLEEINFWGNDIGDVGGRLFLEALQGRKEAKLPTLAVKVCPRMNSDTFDSIRKLSTVVKKRKKRGKKKRK